MLMTRPAMATATTAQSAHHDTSSTMRARQGPLVRRSITASAITPPNQIDPADVCTTSLMTISHAGSFVRGVAFEREPAERDERGRKACHDGRRTGA